jgi:beta-lactamase superfamily II metal-dependent hydrolase
MREALATVSNPVAILPPHPATSRIISPLLQDHGPLPGQCSPQGLLVRRRHIRYEAGKYVVATQHKQRVYSKDELTDSNLKADFGASEKHDTTISREAARNLGGRRKEVGPADVFEDRVIRLQRDAFKVTRTVGATGPRTIVCHVDTALGAAQSLRILDLTSRGDAMLLKASDGSYLLFDTGLSKDAVESIRAELPEKNAVIRVVITHRDQDHVAGLKRLLESADIEVAEVVVGAMPTTGTQTWQTVLRQLQTGYVRHPSLPTLHHYAKSGVKPRFSTGGAQGDASLRSLTLRNAGGTTFDIYQLARPTTENNAALVVRVRHRGKQTLLTSDIGPPAMRALMEAPSVELACGTAKWPHHVWLPRTAADLETLKAFLKRVNPHTVVFSGIGSAAHPGNLRKAVELIRKTLGPLVRVFWTRRDGTVVILTDLDRRQWRIRDSWCGGSRGVRPVPPAVA